jgi:large subunit ribosomal protein L9
MRVLLRDDVDGVGRRGDIVEVADGYARNFLFPSARALKATDSMTGQAMAMRRARDLKVAASEEAARTQAAILGGATISIGARAGATGRLFGSVSAHDIAEAVAAQKGIELDRAALELPEPIKSTGTVEVPVHLYGEISVTLSVEVTPAG